MPPPGPPAFCGRGGTGRDRLAERLRGRERRSIRYPVLTGIGLGILAAVHALKALAFFGRRVAIELAKE